MRTRELFCDNWRFHRGDIHVERPKDKGPVYTQSKTERYRMGPASLHFNDTPDSYLGAIGFARERWEYVRLPHDYVVERVNAVRAEAGAGPLALDDRLCLVAAYRSVEMTRLDYFSHYYNGHARFGEVYKALHNVPYISKTISENIYQLISSKIGLSVTDTKYDLVDEAMEGLIGSPSHYEGMISKNAKYVGFGIYLDESDRKYHVTQIFQN